MTEAAGRIAGGLILLVALWISVYWWWPSDPKVSFAQADDTIRGVTPKEPPPTLTPVEPDPSPRPPVEPEIRPVPTPEPRPQPLPPPAVVPPEFIQHTVQKGETFESIGRKYYGASGRGSIIAKANPMTDPNRLTAGRVIQVPKDPSNIQGVPVQPRPQPVAPAPEEYVVQQGDTLSAIAQEVYGDSRLWRTIFDANRDQLPKETSLRAGQRLRIPSKPER
jgi:nucleoid-associated protein YgaU